MKNCRAPDALVDFHTGREAFQCGPERLFAVRGPGLRFFCPEQLELFSIAAHELVGLSVVDEYTYRKCSYSGRGHARQKDARSRVD